MSVPERVTHEPILLEKGIYDLQQESEDDKIVLKCPENPAFASQLQITSMNYSYNIY
jgi:hypothetical protein